MNPFKDYSYVYVPYCTGDVHAGKQRDPAWSEYGILRWFRQHESVFEPSVPDVSDCRSSRPRGKQRRWFWRNGQLVANATSFGNIRVDMIDDSGTYMPPDILADGNGSDTTEVTVWNLATTRPPPCTSCKTAIDTIFDFYSTAFPDSRGALLSYIQDTVLPSYYGITESQFTTGLGELESSQFNATANPNLAYFAVGSPGHVLWFNPTTSTGNSMTGNFTLQQFITLMESDDPTWQSLHP